MPNPNDYVDVHIRLEGLDPSKAIEKIHIQKAQGGWDWWWFNTGKGRAAHFIRDPGNSTVGHVYIEPIDPYPVGQHFEAVEIWYVGGPYEHKEMYSNEAVDLNKRMPGKELQVASLAQVAQDWVEPSVNVGPDGIQDVRIQMGNLSAANLSRAVLQGPSGGRIWGWGWNDQETRALAETMTAELRNRSGATADLFVGADGNFSGQEFTLTVTYRDGNQAGKTDCVKFTPTVTTSTTAAMPAIPNNNLGRFQAYSEPQDASTGKSRVRIILPANSPAIESARLGNQHGWTWDKDWSELGLLEYDAQAKLFSFPPVRDEEGSTLTLALTFTDGTKAFAQFAGARSDIKLREADTRAGAATNVNSALALKTAIDQKKSIIHLQAGSYLFNAPITLIYPVRIDADPGVTLTFALNGSDYGDAGAFYVNSSHVALDGFAIRFQGYSSAFSPNNRAEWAVIRGKTYDKDVNLSFTNLNIETPRPAPGSSAEKALDLMHFDDRDSGVISGNVLKGGRVVLGHGPWSVTDNTYLGAVANTTSYAFLAGNKLRDVEIRGNRIRQEEAGGHALRFFTFGSSDHGGWFNVNIENNVVYGGIGNPASGDAPFGNNGPEIMMFEHYIPRFEGKPAAISPDGYVVRLPYLLGAISDSGEVVSILDGPHAGQWRMIALRLSDTEYLLTEPFPLGDYAISIGRGLVNSTVRNNVVDTTGRKTDTVALAITGNSWNARVLNNTFIGNNSIRIGGGPAEAYSSVRWGSMLMPTFDLKVDGNTFSGTQGHIGISYEEISASGRVYLTGGFTNNKFIRNGSSLPGMHIGKPDYPQSAHSWISLSALRMTVQGNWWADPSAGGAGTILVTSALVNGMGYPSPTPLNLASAATVTGLSRGQDGRDFIGSGSGSTGPDGFQDIHLVLSGLPEGRTISQVDITGYGGGVWRYGGASGTDRAALVRNGTTADLYIQPYQNETGRYVSVDITYADGSPSSHVVIYSLYAAAGLPTLANRATPSGTVTARGQNAGSGEGAAQAFDGNNATKWLDFSGRTWIQYQFASGAAHVVTQYTITSANDTVTFPTRAPESWTLKGSNDGVNWTVLDSRRGEAITTNSTSRTYRFSNNAAYKYYRFDDILAGKDANGDRGSIIQVGEIALQTSQVVALSTGGSSTAGWFGDGAYVSGGTLGYTTQPIDVSGVVNPAPQSVYQNERYGKNFTYTIPGLTPGGKYTVRLHFAENHWTGAGQRVFNVSINGALALDHFDIFAAAGGRYKAIAREFDATADSLGKILVVFDGTGLPDQPKVGGIEIVIPTLDLARGKTVTSLIDESSSFGPGNVVDGNESTRWSSGQWYRNNQIAWLVIDLGSSFDIDRVKLNWEVAFGVDYQIQVSDDGYGWTTARNIVGATTGGVVEHTNLKARGRYVRIYMTMSRVNPTDNYSLYSVNVYGA